MGKKRRKEIAKPEEKKNFKGIFPFPESKRKPTQK